MAGIVCKLNTRCAVIAACNPKGHYQTDQPLSVNVSLGTPLLSRFDLIFILLDSKNKSWDKLVSSYILFGDTNQKEPVKRWTIEKLQMYISLIGPKPTKITKSANAIIQCYYMLQRKSEYRDPSRTTVRMLDSLIRLSQAHCRLMYRTTILPIDAIIAISLMDLSMQDGTLEDTANALHSNFQKYPDFEYLCTAKKLLTKMSLYDTWKEELLYYGQLLQVDTKTLEEHIDNDDPNLFAKFDDVLDDNMPLSATLVTSSYFNNKKKENVTNKDRKKPDNVINDKLAATLKKHATLNKVLKDPPVSNKRKGIKRKRKEVTVDISKFVTKKQQLQKNGKEFKIDFNIFDSDVEESDSILQLKKREITIHNNRDKSCNNSDKDTSKETTENELKNKDKKENCEEIKKDKSNNINVTSKNNVNQCKVKKTSPRTDNKRSKNKEESKNRKNKKSVKIVEQVNDDISGDSNELNATEMLKNIPSVNDIFSEIGIDFRICDNDSLIIDNNENKDVNMLNQDQNHTNNVDNKSNTIANKLKQFEFSKNHDLDKYKEKTSSKIVKLSKENMSSLSIQRQASSSSQISMFESSDCDIDLDI